MASDGAALGIIFDNLGKTSKYPNISKLLLFSKGAFADAKAVLTETTKKRRSAKMQVYRCSYFYSSYLIPFDAWLFTVDRCAVWTHFQTEKDPLGGSAQLGYMVG